MRRAASTALGAPPAPHVFLHRREFPFPLRLLVHPKNRMTACFPKARGAGRKSTASLYLAPPGVSRGSGRDVGTSVRGGGPAPSCWPSARGDDGRCRGAVAALGAPPPPPGAPTAAGSARSAFGVGAASGAAARPEHRSAAGARRASALVPRERQGTALTESGELNVHIYLLKKIIYICSKALPSLKDKHHLVTKLKK